MKIGDLVKMRFSASDCPVGMIIEEFVHDLADRDIKEVRVQWLDDAGKDVSWVRPKDLEVLSESR
tara:strand:+ start:87 stop:281 length:195 start_codon:yes stop_codon:yes gene_type:complete